VDHLAVLGLEEGRKGLRDEDLVEAELLEPLGAR
jgi:hypothetical protein